MNFVLTFCIATLLILWGISRIIGSLFGIRFPFIRIFLALTMIGSGIILLNGYLESYNQPALAKAYGVTKTNTHTIFRIGQEIFDTTQNNSAEISFYSFYTLFGNIIIKIDDAHPVEIRAHSILSSVTFPDKSSISLGSYFYKTSVTDNAIPIYIEITGILSSIEVIKN
jgi:hypothetical protein